MMKKTTLKLLTLAISLTLILGAAFALSASADTTTTTPEIVSQNICYQGDFALMYAVPVSSVNTEGEGDFFIKVYSDSACETLLGTFAPNKDEGGNLAIETVNGVECYTFTTGGVPAKDMQTVFYSQVTDYSGARSEVKKYSVAEYCLERLVNNTITDAQRRLYNNVLNLGASAEEVLLKKTEKFATDLKYVYTEDEGVTVDGTYDAATRFSGETVTPAYSGSVPAGHTVKFKAGDTLYSSGSAITVSENTNIELVFEKPMMTFDSHTVDASGAWIQDDGTGVKFNPKESAAYEVKEENGNKYLASSFGSASYYSFGITTYTQDGYNAIAYQSKMRFDAESTEGAALTITLHKNGTNRFGFMRLAVNENGNIVLSRANDTNGSAFTEIGEIANVGDWFNIRVEYVIRYARTTTSVYVNDKLVFNGGGSGTVTASSDLVRAQINAVGAAVNFDIDDVVVEKYVGDTSYTFDFEGATNIDNYANLTWTPDVDTNDTEKVEIKSDATHGDYLEATMYKRDIIKFEALTNEESGYNAVVFETKMMLNGSNPYMYFILGGTDSTRVKMNVNSNGVSLVNDGSNATQQTVGTSVKKGEWFTVRFEYTANETSGYTNVEMTVRAADGTEFSGTGVVQGALGTTMLIKGYGSNDGIVCLDDVTLERVKK